MKNKNNNKFMDIIKSVRKPLPKPSRVIMPKKQKYDRKDKSWLKGE